MQLSIGDLFWAITLPLIITFIGIMATFILTYLRLLESLSHIEAHTARLPEMERELNMLVGALMKGNQSVKMNLNKTGIEAIISVRDRWENKTLVVITFNADIMPMLAESTADSFRSWVEPKIIKVLGAPRFLHLTLEGGKPQVNAQMVKEYLQRLDEVLSGGNQQWAEDFERSLGKGA